MGLIKTLAITGTRADYGLMTPVYRAIANDKSIELHLVVTGMHYLPEFKSGLDKVRSDKIGMLHEIKIDRHADSGRGMSDALAEIIAGLTHVVDTVKPDIILLQGDRGEMLAGAITGAYANVAVVHMSGGDTSGSIDDSIRNAISKFAHFHLTNCSDSSQRLISLGEQQSRIVNVGEPSIDLIGQAELLPWQRFAESLRLDPSAPFLIGTLHPVVGEESQAVDQMTKFLEAIERSGLAAVVTYPNSDAGGNAMQRVLESWRDRPFLRIEANMGSTRYLSAMRYAAAMVGNSSSGICEAPSFKLPVVNIGSRQQGRARAVNVVDVDFDVTAIAKAIGYVCADKNFKARLEACKNPYGDGKTSQRVVDVLKRLKLDGNLIAKWRPVRDVRFLTEAS